MCVLPLLQRKNEKREDDGLNPITKHSAMAETFIQPSHIHSFHDDIQQCEKDDMLNSMNNIPQWHRPTFNPYTHSFIPR